MSKQNLIDNIAHNCGTSKAEAARIVEAFIAGVEDELANGRNVSTPSSNKSGVRGVYWNKSLEKWHAQIQIHGKKFHIGYFDSISAAKEARALAAIKKHGDFASELRGLV